MIAGQQNIMYGAQVKAENECMKTVAFVFAIVHCVMHIAIGPLEAICILISFVCVITGGWSMIFLFLLFGLAAVGKWATIVLTFYTTRTTTDKFELKVYQLVFLVTVIINAISCGFVAYGNIRYIDNLLFTFIHVYFLNYCFLLAVAGTAWAYVSSKGTKYILIPSRPMQEVQPMQMIQTSNVGYYYP